MAIEFERLTDGPLGARVRGVDPGLLDETTAARLRDEVSAHHGLLCFEFGRLLELDELHALTRVFGEPEFGPGRIVGFGRGAHDLDDVPSVDEQVAELLRNGIDPYLTNLGNVDPDTGETRDVGDLFYGEWEWHTDMSYVAVPPAYSLLHSRVVPAEGGDTGFCDQVQAAAELPDDLRRQIEGRMIKHDSTYTSSGAMRPGMAAPATPMDAPGSLHPPIRRLSGSGEHALFLGRRTNGYIDGLALEASEQLLDQLWAHATQERFQYRHRWRVGEVVVWDNRRLLHLRHPFDASDQRWMWRTQTRGERVVAA